MATPSQPPRPSSLLMSPCLFVSMGHRSSRTAPEHVREEDTHSAWGSDIDETFCGPGKICADEWTPLNSLPPSPEETRRRFSVFSIQDDNHVITEQPGFTVGNSTIEGSNYDAMTIFHDDAVSTHYVTPILVAPVEPRSLRKRKRKRRVIRNRRKKSVVETVSPDVFPDRRHPTSRTKQTFARSHPKRKVIRIRRITVRHDPRYPMIPPPKGSNVRFRRCHPDDVRFVKAVPPSHLKGTTVAPKPHFRYKGVRTIIV